MMMTPPPPPPSATRAPALVRASGAIAMEVDYELSQQLQGHTSQVRCAAILGDSTIVTGGLDAQVIMWRRSSPAEGFALYKKLGHHSDFVYALGPSASTPGCFYSGSKDKTAVRIDPEGNPVMQYVGHEGPVCSLTELGTQLVTGAWDGKAKVWDCATGELKHTLDAGAHAVTVAVLPTGEIVTGSQDRSLRVFRGAECVHKVDEAHGDIIRAISTSSTHLVTASNDNSLKMWSFDGCEMATLAGHQSFVYGVTHSPDGQTILSTSDDCTLKLWSTSDLQCGQSIIHAGTVWQGTSLPNGDIVTTCADMVVRVWSRDPARMAPEAERQTHKEMAEQAAMAAAGKGSSSVPMESAADISKMPTTIGKKNGEIKCFRDGATVFAFSWNAGARQWDKIGEVVGGESEKKHYAGDSVFPAGEYDFVFDVDMGPAHGMRKLPFNRGQNPMEVAESFCSREQIHKGNTEQIRQFIIQNAGGEGAVGGGGGAASSAPAAAPEPTSTLFPVMSPATFKDGKLDALLGKIIEFNGQVDASLQMDATEVTFLNDAIAKLKTGILKEEFRPCEREVIFVKLKAWPKEKIFPVIDLWRLMLVYPMSSDYFKGSDRGTSFITQVTGFLSADPNGGLGLCSARYLANLFIYQTNRYALVDKKDLVFKALEPALSSTNKHVKVACASVLLNLAVVLHERSEPPKAWDAASGATVAQLALGFLEKAGPDDVDALQRALLAIGTLLPRDRKNGCAIVQVCKDKGLPARLGSLEGKVPSNVVSEVRMLLG
mmetsp:Transcript_32365/g.68977  ORF Transcript_32365/g.68977 Transcript_32365/m.68977 type:complete len:772 (+) Transcript_32365:3-2318(+)